MSGNINSIINNPAFRALRMVFSILTLFVPAVAGAIEVESVVTIYSKSDNSKSSQGTGFIIASSGKILTAYHVIADAVEIEVFDNNFNKLHDVKVDRIDERRDLAMLTFQPSGTAQRLQLSGNSPPAYAEISVAGSPRGLPKQVLFGKISSNSYVQSTAVSSAGGKRVFREAIDVLPVDVTVYSGMSGAPVMLSDGTVIGVLSGSYDEGRGLAWAIPVKYVDELNKRPSLNLKVSSAFRWPKLSLMNDSWVSLKRSYSQPFTSTHLARIESLEGLFRTLRGKWKGISDMNLAVYSDKKISNYFGSCTLEGTQTHTLDIRVMDADEPQISGLFLSSSKAKMNVEFGTAGNDSAREMLYRSCGVKSKNDLPRVDLHVSGRIIANSLVDEDVPTDKKGYMTKINVENCIEKEEAKCKAAAFGEKKTGRLEIINKDRIRWQGTILDRVSN